MILVEALSGVGLSAEIGNCTSSNFDDLEYSWTPPKPMSVNSLGSIHVQNLEGIKAKDYKLDITVEPSGAPLTFQGISCADSLSKKSFTLKFQVASRAVELVLNLVPGHAGTMAIDISANQLSVAAIAVGGWPDAIKPQSVAVPYYTNPITWLPGVGLFSNIYWDWTVSRSTRLTDTSAVYQPLTNGLRNSLHDRLVVKMSHDLDEVLPDIPNPRSTYMSQVAGRTVLDIWGPSFSTISARLARLRDAGLRDCVVLIHVWQQSGFDNGLPGHYPANSALGGDAGLAAAVQTGNSAGCFVGLHENYVDYYPDYVQFDSHAIALDSKGQRQTAWYNPGLPIQSLATRPTLLLPNAASQSPEIHRRYKTTASFIDVNSGNPPWFRSDMDDAAPGAGMFSTYQQASKDLWEFERTVHGGPVFGEGDLHWFWSGLLDGVEGQFGAANIKASNPQAPLFVDFDLLKMHPLQVNHGMGYYDRWLPAGQTIRQTALLDAYRMQEVAYGHAPYVGSELWNDVPQVVIEQNLVGPVAKRYGTEVVTNIQYEIDGDWKDTNVAVAAEDWSRVQVRYSNGDFVVANARPEALNWQGLTIPQNGWAAKGDGLLAYTAIKAGQIVDYSETTTSYFANARNQNDLQYAGITARPSISLIQQPVNRTATFQIRWEVFDQPDPGILANFIHFVTNNGSIAFQADHVPSTPTQNWAPGQTVLDRVQVDIPPTIADGTYSMRVGLYSPVSGIRVKLVGQDDGTTRYIMGNLVITNAGKTVTFRPAISQSVEPDPRLNSARNVIDFGTIQTDGIVSLRRDGGSWRLQAYPNLRNVIVRLNSNIFPPPSLITCDTGPAQSQSPSTADGFWSVQTMGSNYCKW